MTYPNIKPNLEIQSTISHPIYQERVIGFVARNTLLGRRAIVIKTDSIISEKVLLPTEASGSLTDGTGELAVLRGDEVLTMNGSDFAEEYQLHTVEGRGQTATMNFVNLDSENFESWDRNVVEISN